PHMWLNGVPAFMFFLLGTALISGGLGDLKVIRHGALKGRPRLSRHLWRMCFAFFIAVGSFFSIKARVATILPEPLTALPIRMAVILSVFVAMFYWLWRIRRRKPPV